MDTISHIISTLKLLTQIINMIAYYDNDDNDANKLYTINHTIYTIISELSEYNKKWSVPHDKT